MEVSQIGSSQRKPDLLTPNEKPHGPKRDHTETTEPYLGGCSPPYPPQFCRGAAAPQTCSFAGGLRLPDPPPGGYRPLDPRLI